MTTTALWKRGVVNGHLFLGPLRDLLGDLQMTVLNESNAYLFLGPFKGPFKGPANDCILNKET